MSQLGTWQTEQGEANPWFVHGIPAILTPLTLSLYFLVFWGIWGGESPPPADALQLSCSSVWLPGWQQWLCAPASGQVGATAAPAAQHRAGTLQQVPVPVPSAGPTAGWSSLGQAEISWICRRAFVTTPNLCRSPVQPVAKKAISVNVISS